jgi:hypothetical protein
MHRAILNTYWPLSAILTEVASDGNLLLSMQLRSGWVKGAGFYAIPTANALIRIDASGTGLLIDEARLVFKRTGEVAARRRTMLTYVEGEIVGKGISD